MLRRQETFLGEFFVLKKNEKLYSISDRKRMVIEKR